MTLDELTALMELDALSGFGPQKFREIHDARLSAADVVKNPSLLPVRGKRGDDFRMALSRRSEKEKQKVRDQAAQQLARAYRSGALILTFDSAGYPRNVWESNNPIPILYVLGDTGRLAHTRSVACVGSRQIGGVYADLHAAFAREAVNVGFTIVSGFAVGADAIGHREAYHAGGDTLCVMPCGLDRPFPPENRSLWNELLKYRGAVMISEFPFGTGASALTLRKRNKLIAAAARGVLISESSASGGAMNAYRFALDQHKPVATFSTDGTDKTSGNALIGKGQPPGYVFSTEVNSAEWAKWLNELPSST
jgi:DNA protecting protein DprA